jgi:2-methylcitrate dehydratase
MDKTREKLVSYAAALRYQDLTPKAVHAVKRSVIDSVGCALGAFDAAPAVAARKLAAQVSAIRPATVIGTDIRSTPEHAAFANGAMVRYADFNDDYFGGTGQFGPHPSDNISPVLAATEAMNADGKTLILGIVTAYEICCQIVDHTHLHEQGSPLRKWDYPILHSISSSLGTAKVLGLTEEQMGNAVSLAIVPNIPLNQTRYGKLSNWKSLAGPNACRNGLFAALAAQAGITGPEEPFEGRAGYMNILPDRFELAAAFGGNGTPFKIEGSFIKCLPVRYGCQLPIWVALELRTKIKLDDVEALCVYIEDRPHRVVDRADEPEYWNPMSRETADHSFPYLVGAALVDGEINAKTFTPERFRDPTILSVVQKIRLAGDQAYNNDPWTYDCRIEATLRSGDVVTVHQRNPKGHPGNPASDEDIEQKFLKQVDGRIPASQSRTLLDTLWQLDKLDDIKKLFPMMLMPGNR